MKRLTVLKSTLIAASMLPMSAGLLAQETEKMSTEEITPQLFSGVKDYRTWSFGIHGGVMAPSVLIGGNNDFTKSLITMGYGAYVKKQVTHDLGFQAEFLKGTLKANNERSLGNGADPQSPYSSFKTTLNWGASISGVYNICNINWLHNESVITPYVSAGAGLLNYNATITPTGSTTEIERNPTGHTQELYIPVGAGFKVGLSRGINLDLGYRMNFVDNGNLDGYDTHHNDRFSYGHIGLEFALGSKKKKQLAMHNPAAQLATELRNENAALKAAIAAKQAPQQPNNQPQIDALKAELASLKTDSDGDGVADYFDKCPNTPAGTKVDGAGCPLPEAKNTTIIKPVVTDADKKVVTEAVSNLEFATGKSTISPKSYATLARLAKMLVAKDFNLKLSGHTDNVGSAEKNLSLSRERAEAVKAYLVSEGVNASKIEAVGYGSTQPIASNKTAEGRQQNRRVEFNIF